MCGYSTVYLGLSLLHIGECEDTDMSLERSIYNDMIEMYGRPRSRVNVGYLRPSVGKMKGLLQTSSVDVRCPERIALTVDARDEYDVNPIRGSAWGLEYLRPGDVGVA